MKISITAGVLSLVFLLSGSVKLLALSFEVEAFARWGYPLWFMYLTGVCEVAGALGLQLPRLRFLAALCLGCLMLGAADTHLIHAEWPMLAAALIIMGACLAVTWSGRDRILDILKP